MALLELDLSDGWTPSDGSPPLDAMLMGPSLMGSLCRIPSDHTPALAPAWLG